MTARRGGLTVVTVVALLMFALTACGNNEPSESAAKQPVAAEKRAQPDGPQGPPPAGPGDYTWYGMNGAEVTVTVPTDANDPRVRRYEAYRKTAGAPPVTYFVAEVDNTEGTTSASVDNLTVVTEEGDQVVMDAIDFDLEILGGWMDRFGANTNKAIDAYNRGVDLTNNLTTSLVPGAKGNIIIATPETVDSVARVFVHGDEAYKQPTSEEMPTFPDDRHSVNLWMKIDTAADEGDCTTLDRELEKAQSDTELAEYIIYMRDQGICGGD